jgi:hypothetical protein
MNRRDLIKAIGIITGYSMVGGATLLTSCNTIKNKNIFADKITIELLNEIAETLLPKTNTPGAKDADCGTMMATIINDCYSTKEQDVIIKGLPEFENYCKIKFGNPFIKLSTEEKLTALKATAEEASAYNKSKLSEAPVHYFTMLKQLAIFSFFTSKEGATKALRYLPVPGKYDGDFNYRKGDKAWAT